MNINQKIILLKIIDYKPIEFLIKKFNNLKLKKTLFIHKKY